MKKNTVFVHEKKNLLICPRSPRMGGGLKALVDMSAKDVNFFDGLPNVMVISYVIKVTGHYTGAIIIPR